LAVAPVLALRHADLEAAALPGRLIRRKRVPADPPVSVAIAALVSPPEKASVYPVKADPLAG
jgi:hypothetical protein